MSKATTLLLLGALTGCAGAEAAPTTPTAAALDRTQLSHLSGSTVTLNVLFEGLWGQGTSTQEASGSGFVVDAGGGPVVVTAAHVVAGATEIDVVDAEGRRSSAVELVALDEDADVAALRVTGLDASVAPIPVGTAPGVGEDVMLVSSPLGLSTTVAFGTVAALRPEVQALQLAAGVSPGSSGGLVADRRGRAVAIIRSKASADVGGENITLATTIDRLTARLRKDERIALAPRPDPKKMAALAEYEVLTTRTPEGNRGVASVVVQGEGEEGVHAVVRHLCAEASDGEAVIAIRELGDENPDSWREGVGRTCATVWRAQPVVVWVGTKAVGSKVQLFIRRQK